jgi:hypothetical protein
MIKLTEYTTETQVYYTAGVVQSNCNSLIFFCGGSNLCIIDGIMLQPNQSLAITGNENEINIKNYSFYFTDALGGPVNTGYLTVIRKIYLGSSAPSYALGRKPDPSNC